MVSPNSVSILAERKSNSEIDQGRGVSKSLVKQQIGGLANQAGNRYERNFTLSRVLLHAREYAVLGHDSEIKAQAGVPVDDLVIRCHDRMHHYYQLKNDQQITWGADGNALENDFCAQQAHCKKSKQRYWLYVVVPYDHR